MPPVDPTTYTVLFPFCGLGAGALGFLQAQHEGARFRALGGLDIDPLACQDFARLTKAPAWRVDVTRLSPAQLRERYGTTPPDVVFLSPPCKGASGLLSKKAAASEKYQAMNRLAYVWIALMLAAWGDQRPRLILLENVPRLTSRAGAMLSDVRGLLTAAGYVLHEGYHDCGELGGLAQHRRRYLLIARHASVAHLLYQPPKQRVRGCGEVLGELPLPGDPVAGPMHRLPRISWLNAIRLALIPAGGDWRDLPGVLAEGERRGKKWKRHKVESWPEPVGAVAGTGSNGVANVADPRASTYHGSYGVTHWASAAGAGTVTGGAKVSAGTFSVADPRLGLGCLGPATHQNLYRVTSWQAPTGTVTGAGRPGQGAPSVADPRLPLSYATRDGTLAILDWTTAAQAVTGQSGRTGHCSGGLVADPRLALACAPYAGAYGVTGWAAPSATVTASAGLDNGAFAVADPRLALLVPQAYDHGYMPLSWAQPAFTLAGKTSPGCGAYAVADPRLGFVGDNPGRHWNKYRVGSWQTPAGAVIGAVQVGSGAPSLADPRVPGLPPHMEGHRVLTWLEAAATLEDPGLDPSRPSAEPTLIIAADGTWHRPMTTLELAVLQGLPAMLDGAPLVLSGGSAQQRMAIGNAVPVGAARAIAEQMLKTLAAADAGAMFLDASPVWVAPPAQRRPGPTPRPARAESLAMKLHGYLALVAREADGWSCALVRLDADPTVDPVRGLAFASSDPRTELQATRLLTKRAGTGEPILGRYRYAGGQVKLLPGEAIDPAKGKAPGPAWTTLVADELAPAKGRTLNLYRLLAVAAPRLRAELAGKDARP